MLLRAESPSEAQVQNSRGFDDYELKLGDIMRGERATLGKSLLDVQRELRIRATFIAAIENCDLSAFDVPSFVAGYVRSYARYLGMDPDDCFRRFCAESGFQAVPAAPSAAAGRRHHPAADASEGLANPHPLFIPRPEPFWSGVEPRSMGAILVLALLVGGLGYGGWSVLREIQRVDLSPVDAAPGVIAMLDPAQDLSRAAPDATSAELGVRMPAPETLDRIYRPQALELPVLTRRDGPIAAIDTARGDADAEREAEASAPAPTGAPGETAAIAEAVQQALAPAAQGPHMAADPVRTVAPDAPTVELLAVRPAWVRVTAPDGSVILEKTMDAGERFALPKLEMPPVLRTGNSGAVYFAVNGETFGPAAPGAQVVKNIELSPDALTERFALAEPDNDPELAKMIAVASAEAHADPETDSPEVRPED